MKADYEEKTYENFFNNELNNATGRIFFPLGQAQEGFLGFDASGFSRNRRLWRRLGHRFWFHPPFIGEDLQDIAHEMEAYLSVTIKGIPKMRANLLFQYKRSSLITLNSGAEWKHWNQPYFRYDVYKEQQQLLMQLHSKFSSNVLILYAAPATNNVTELVQKHQARQIIATSNFKRAVDLNNHHRNTFIEAGTYSIACSEPERIDDFDFVEYLNSFGRYEESDDEYYNSNFILNFCKKVIEVVNENEYYGSAFKTMNNNIEKYYSYELLYHHLALSNLRILTGIQWLIKF